MRPRDIKREVMRALRTQVNTILLGPPGVGKTEVIKSIADEAEIGFIRIVLPQYEEVDLRGIPEVNENKKTVFYPTEELPFVEKHGNVGILLLDELPSAKPPVQVITHQLLDARSLGSIYEMPEGWIIVATGNRQEDYAFVYEMPSTVRTRCTILNYDVNHEDWKAWGYDTGLVEPEVMAFTNNNPDCFMMFTPDKPVTNHSMPRTLTLLSRYLKDIKEQKEEASLEYIVGTIGEAAGNKFFGWLKVWNEVPNIDDILEGKDVKVPTKADRQWCVISAVTAKLVACEAKKVLKSTQNALKYIDQLSSDIVMAFLNDLMQTKFWKANKKSILKTKEWIALSKNHARTIVGTVS